MKSITPFTGLLLLFLASSCHKDDDSLPLKKCFINERCTILEGQFAEITDTTRYVIDSSTNKMEHPIYIAKFEQVVYDNRAWGVDCGVLDFGRINPAISLSKGQSTIIDTFNYGQCINYDLPINSTITHILLDGASLFLLRAHPLPLEGSLEKDGSASSVEVKLIH